jgi:hypothetical protein
MGPLNARLDRGASGPVNRSLERCWTMACWLQAVLPEPSGESAGAADRA